MLVAVLGLTTVLATGGTAVSATPGHAVAAKKKCKKKHLSAESAKKKKCKKKKVVLPLPGPMVRGVASWTDSAEVDLHAFDASGNHTGWVNTGVVNGIPNAVHSGDKGPGGPSESFTDNIFVQGGSNREFAYVVCIYDAANVTFTGTTATGQSSSVPLSGTGSYTLTVPTSPPIPYNPC